MFHSPGPPQKHPRRAPPEVSVSLRHSHLPSDEQRPPRQPRIQYMPASGSGQANPLSSTSSHDPANDGKYLKPEVQKESSGESSNAENWFDRSNNKVEPHASNAVDSKPVSARSQHYGTYYMPGEPPFYLRHSSSSQIPPENSDLNPLPQLTLADLQKHSRETVRSGSDEFRSIVDDLTVENKRLKRRLRKYEKMHDAHLQQERLFEIRVHGLSGSKKRELEETLRKFASSLGNGAKSESVESSLIPSPCKQAAKLSDTSNQFADSAYVSNSTSGHHSLATSGVHSHTNSSIQQPRASRAQQRGDMQTYLHDIPPGLMPRHPVAMTEKTKKKLVVRRLEQLFAGKGAALGGNQQPLQQEQVSQSAAHEDRMAIEASGEPLKAEGLREARIHSQSSPEALQVASGSQNETAQTKNGYGSPDQRSTRPLDLDPYRAQDPRDNIDYIRHLGFSPADFDSAQERDQDHGWIYLNLLTNMAQLHTENVTTGFVKKAISEYSKKLLLSRDGRKVRWKGGHDVTRTSSDGSPVRGTQSPSIKGDAGGATGKKRSKVTSDSSDASSASHVKSSSKPTGKQAYVPLFHRKISSDGDLTSEENTSSAYSASRDHLAGNSSGFTSPGISTNSTRRKRIEDGPIIFYNKARFCTDLSADTHGLLTGSYSATKYHRVTAVPIGTRPTPTSEPDYRRLAPNENDSVSDRMDAEEDSQSQTESSVHFSPKTLSSVIASPSRPASVTFDASGVGGVHPEDNFHMNVQSHHSALDNRKKSQRATHLLCRRLYTSRLLSIFNPSQDLSGMDGDQPSPEAPLPNHVLSVRRTDLASSTLPPPASLFRAHSLEHETEKGYDSHADSDAESTSNSDDFPLSTAPQMLYLSSVSPDKESEGDDDEADDDDDASVDLLTSARKTDPVTVHAREREFKADVAERIASEIPAGSSAATAGGGSGYSSPAPLDIVAPSAENLGTVLHVTDGRPSSVLKRPRPSSGDGTAAYAGGAKFAKMS